jgi:hypothetical protein
VRIATALEDLPELADALANGELTRVATRATEQAWLDDARGKNLRQIEQAVAGRKRGDRPSDPADPELVAQRSDSKSGRQRWRCFGKRSRCSRTSVACGSTMTG